MCYKIWRELDYRGVRVEIKYDLHRLYSTSMERRDLLRKLGKIWDVDASFGILGMMT